MTDKEKRELKDGVISIFKRFNILDHTSTIGGLRDDILRYIDSLQEEPVSEELQTEIEDYINRNFSEGSDGCLISDKNKSLGGVTYSEIGELARHFANWQREQMIKNSIEVKVKADNDGLFTTETWNEMNELLQKISAKADDKVYISIIKQEDEL